MNLLDRIFHEPELIAAPPVLVDVGAAGGVPRIWRPIARHAVAVAFEPDTREAAALTADQNRFRRWIRCPALAVPATPPGGTQKLHLTRSPQCSSTLLPQPGHLGEWAFADQFDVVRTEVLPAASLADALAAQGIARIDWLKCDTQGTDLRLFASLPVAWRAGLLLADFEPGFIDAYAGEDRIADVLQAMTGEPFWLAGFEPGCTPRVRRSLIESVMPGWLRPWVRRLAPTAPAWAGLRYLRDVARAPVLPGRREWLLTWVFAQLAGQPGYALAVATEGQGRFGGALFAEMSTASLRQLQWAMLAGLPGWAWRRFAK
jgi:FkbM family methyltransferase